MTLRRTVVGGLAVIGALALVLGVGGGVYGLAVARRGFSAREEPSALEAKVARAARSFSMPAGARELKNPLIPLPSQALANARAHWGDHCAICHAADGSGQTPIGQGLYPRPPDMRAAPTQDLSDGELYWIIQNGIRLTGMPAWGQAHDDAGNNDSWALVGLIRTLPRLSPEELDDIKAAMPQSQHELNEKRMEDEFLEGQ
ncbi:c-type cytochrome [Corallococcus macrosporus]|uniref:Cytochrome c n=1 Tax=Corallococcus macrosporus DSM 14697 TaxID=1189310 RepID=A0A250JQX0_9BACT|nr:c-type cytochrome [Corallococcus macrosporus]ATB46269.1 cytochrome c [Corallococcus macrosporus DSM 14697]